MTPHLVILRPTPGAHVTQRRAEAQGWRTAMVPLFSIEARDWSAPDPEAFDAVLMTSANAAGEAGAALAPFTRLPAYAVGEATGRAARGAGFDDVVIGAGTSEDAADRLRADGRRLARPGLEADADAIQPHQARAGLGSRNPLSAGHARRL
ncbi:MAG: uroporphyrinogen-III synthase [Sphingomonadales bacterium]|nr:uroporphyrinogen-III synthase [Sphingomonadales bacterium]